MHVHFMCEHARVFLWRPETDGRCLLLLSTLLFKTESLTGPGTLRSGKTTWPPSSRQPPVCLSRGKTSVMHGTFHTDAGDLNWGLVFAQFTRQAISLALQPAPLI